MANKIEVFAFHSQLFDSAKQALRIMFACGIAADRSIIAHRLELSSGGQFVQTNWKARSNYEMSRASPPPDKLRAKKRGIAKGMSRTTPKKKCFWRGGKNCGIVLNSCPFGRCLSIGI